MIVEVEMVAFAKFGKGKDFGIREVHVPDEEACRAGEDKLLELVFRYGQNDVQPVDKPSVSVGDVIRVDNKRFLVTLSGFERIKPNEEGGLMKGYRFAQ